MREIKYNKNFKIITVIDPGADDFDFIENEFKIERNDLEEFKMPYHLSDYDVRTKYSFLVISFPKEKNFLKEALEIENVYFFFSNTFFICLSKGESLVNKIIDDILDDPKISLPNTEKLLYYILKSLLKVYYSILRTIDHEINFLDKNINKLPPQILNQRIVFLKKNLILFLTNTKSFYEVFEEIVKNRMPNFRRYSHLWEGFLDEVNYIYVRLEDYQLIIDGYQRSIENILSININKNILLITLIQTLFLPPTLIASIYGMNVNLPLAHKNYAFYLILFFMFFISILFWLLLIKKKG